MTTAAPLAPWASSGDPVPRCVKASLVKDFSVAARLSEESLCAGDVVQVAMVAHLGPLPSLGPQAVDGRGGDRQKPRVGRSSQG